MKYAFGTEQDYLWGDSQKKHHDIINNYLKGKLHGNVLDIGERNPLTVLMEEANGISIDSTEGDLDTFGASFGDDRALYHSVVFSHVIEHLFNPLNALWRIQDFMVNDGVLYIIAPIKPYWITPKKCHFHEMDEYRFRKLIERAGFKITDWYKYSVPIPFRFSIRNWLRRFYKEWSIVTCEIA